MYLNAVFILLCLTNHFVEITNGLASSYCKPIGNFRIRVKAEKDTREYVIPNMTSTGMNLITINKETNDSWIIYECKANEYWMIKYSRDTNLLWTNEGKCNGSKVGLSPEPLIKKPEIKFSQRKNEGYLTVCDRCLYRSKDGKIMSSKKCNKEKDAFSIEFYS